MKEIILITEKLKKNVIFKMINLNIEREKQLI